MSGKDLNDKKKQKSVSRMCARAIEHNFAVILSNQF